jgi:DNA topoisomerase-2
MSRAAAASSSSGFEWLSAREAVLRRPDAYVGSIEPSDEEVRLYREDGSSETVRYTMSPILMKICDEVLVNAIDCTVRDSLVRNICVFLEEGGGVVVENDGSGIPIEIFENTDRLIPSVIFSELHAGSNFKDSEIRLTGGRNGVGVSCTNVWSTLFEVEVRDGRRRFFQRFRDNLGCAEEPEVTEHRSKTGLVRVRFVPDYARLGVDLAATLPLIRKLLYMRCVEASVCTRAGVTVSFQGAALNRATSVGSEEFGADETGAGCVITFGLRKEGLDFYGFVNGVRCDGGTLTTHVRDRLLRAIADMVRKKHNLTVHPQTVRECLCLVCVARVVNPAFTSQAKTVLSTSVKKFGFQVDIPQKMLTKLSKLGIIDAIVAKENERELNLSLKKTAVPKTREVMIEKYDAALDCRRDPDSCTLILTEGDSAKAFVVAGLSAIGREKHGVFPLRGVPLNVTGVGVAKMLENKEIANIFRILNVGPHSDGKGLRYGKIAICSDQDSDGSHICGLLINFVVTCLPDVLAKRPCFIQRIVTPLIRATKKRGQEEKSFFSMQQYCAWERENDVTLWNVKYYKGLGTSTSKEARQLFKALPSHSIGLVEDAAAKDTLLRFYDEARVDERKQLLTEGYDDSVSLDYGERECSITSFMLQEHVHFSYYSVFRALPSALDGLTPSRRKALFFFLSSRASGETKVAQAASAVAHRTLYLHGENSLVETIVSLAQDYVGTNNVALLQPLGQFGSRNDKPSVHSAARYIFTKLDPIALALFPLADGPVLEHRSEEGQQVEPVNYVPVVPTLLVNGAQGIGTGFSTSVPCYSLPALCEAARRYIRGEAIEELPPYFHGFRGEVEVSARGVLTKGALRKTGPRSWTITELPVGRWTEPFLTDLKAIAEGTKSCKDFSIVSVVNNSTEFRVEIEVVLGEDAEDVDAATLLKGLRLQSSISTTHMYAFDAAYRLRRYADAREIVEEHARARLSLYERRRCFELDAMKARLELLDAKIRFIQLIVAGELQLRGLPREALVGAVLEKGLPAIPTKSDAQGFEYLLSISVGAFTKEKIEALESESAEVRSKRETLEKTTAADMWLQELATLEEAYDDYLERVEHRHSEEPPASTGSGRGRAKVLPAARSARKRGGAASAAPKKRGRRP